MGNIEAKQQNNNVCQQCGTTDIQFINSEIIYINTNNPLTAFTVIYNGNCTHYYMNHFVCVNGHKFNCIHL